MSTPPTTTFAKETPKTFSTLSILSQSSVEDCSKERQSLLLRDLELLLDLTPSTLRSNLLALPREIREQIFQHVIPSRDNDESARPTLHTPFWSADMIHEPWSHDTFGYAPSVPLPSRLPPYLLLINRQLRDEILQCYWRHCDITLHVELRNSRSPGSVSGFKYSPHVRSLSMLKEIAHVRFYVEWNYALPTGLGISTAARAARREYYVEMVEDLVRTMGRMLETAGRIETIQLSILFFWTQSKGMVRVPYQLSMQDLFDLEEVCKRGAEGRWLGMLGGPARDGEDKKKNKGNPDEEDINDPSGVGYKLLVEHSKGTEQSGAMEIYIARDLEEAMGRSERRRESMANVDFYGNFGVVDVLPQPAYKPGGMI
ncbi:uncharacterized protein EI97DRAFT_416571 [Westerdykella ornata]|uniref:F-box domain-containing protein n=1 Tax=Westerdykella ornata TaxID=318751 RepID=A0A6A6JMW4_WESOR|nr:uncharacterized protein EI97DRAFT_416571 [Westerdykella ornata]KAF2277565.1 hypothetical protein EI97DRAFT_416571 [Westerdykella ornata]